MDQAHRLADGYNRQFLRVLRKELHRYITEEAQQKLARREEDSITAEFAPRARLESPHLARANLQPLITKNGGVQKVRITGILMFDSEHSLGHHLHRHNNWEIHPVLDMDYCPKGKKCTADSDDNWVKLGEEP